MLTKQHVALAFLAFANKGYSMKEISRELPWVVLPDAIRMYSGARQTSHFEKAVTGEVSYMVFPNEYTLKNLDKQRFFKLVEFHKLGEYPKCVIGEETILPVFDSKNYGNEHFHSLRIHLKQDRVLDETLRTQLVNCERRFEDHFQVLEAMLPPAEGETEQRHEIISGAELRRQVALFENIGFVHLANKVYEATGEVLNNEWFEENVLKSLKLAYPDEMVPNTFKYMVLDDEDEYQVNSKEGVDWCGSEKVEEFRLCGPEKLVDILDEMYAKAYIATAEEI